MSDRLKFKASADNCFETGITKCSGEVEISLRQMSHGW